jgi:hypothetical protein
MPNELEFRAVVIDTTTPTEYHDLGYQRRKILNALGVPEEYIYDKPKPKLLTRFQILKNNE